MKAIPVVTSHGIPLRLFISSLTEKFQDLAKRRKNIINNDIQGDLELQTNDALLYRIFSALLKILVTKSENCLIRLTSKTFSNIILVHITNSNGRHEKYTEEEIAEINKLAEILGGCLYYNDQHLNESTFTVSLIKNTLL